MTRPPPRRAGPWGAALVPAVAVLLLACDGADGDGPRTLGDSVYVEVMARLVVLDSALSPRAESPDGGSVADSLRDLVLERWDVDPDGLLDYARTRGASPERMEAVWRRVHELSDSLEAAGWSPGDELPAQGDTARAPADSAEDDPAGGDTLDTGGDTLDVAGPQGGSPAGTPAASDGGSLHTHAEASPKR